MRLKTMTVRVDEKSHAELLRLSRSYARIFGSYMSIADVVRMGITLLAKVEARKLESVDAVQEQKAAGLDVRE